VVEMKYSNTVRPSRKFEADRSLHDFAGGLGMRRAYPKAGESAVSNAGAGVRHDVDGVDDAFLVVASSALNIPSRDFFGDVAQREMILCSARRE